MDVCTHVSAKPGLRVGLINAPPYCQLHARAINRPAATVRRHAPAAALRLQKICSARTTKAAPTPLRPNCRTTRAAPRLPVAARCKPYIAGAVYKRGSRVIVCAALAGVEGAVAPRDLLSQPLPAHKSLVVGQLPNGLRYVVLPNKTPPDRFEAHLEVHAGSVDELAHEQGVAHLVEHVTFLGSKKREGLLGTGSRANAYTDFHHTVFHVHAPLRNAITNQPMLPQVLEALVEIAFQPQFLPTRIEKERKAVLAEAQMMNTIEYRVDCQLLKYLHEENSLGCRFPIGQTEQIKKWGYDVLRSFWDKWYFPANTTLYIVGVMEQDVVPLIEHYFGCIPAARDKLPNGAEAGNGTNGAAALAPLRQRHAIRPPVVHENGCGPVAPAAPPVPISMFRHPLLQQFMLTIFCKLPVIPLVTPADIKHAFMLRILLGAFQFRISARYGAGTSEFLAIELDISDSGREGCAVSTLTITSEPEHWEKAVAVAMEEVRRLREYGITPGEFKRYKQALLRDSQQLADQADSIPSVDSLNFVMEALALGHVVMDQQAANEVMHSVGDQITLEEVNALCRSMMAFASDYGHEGEAWEDFSRSPQLYSSQGPTRATSIVACVPMYVDESGRSIAPGPAPRKASLGASGHLDADAIDLEALEAEAAAQDLVEAPEGSILFDVSPEQLARVLADHSTPVEPVEDVDVPDFLMEDGEVQRLMEATQPHWIPLEYTPVPGRQPPTAQTTALPHQYTPVPGLTPSVPPPSTGAPPAPPSPELPPLAPLAAPDLTKYTDPVFGITLRRLSNGIRLNYVQTDHEPSSCMVRIAATGGRAQEQAELGGLYGPASVLLGTRTMSESGTVGRWKRQQVEVFCISHLVNCVVDTDEEFIVLDFHFAVPGGGMRAIMELLHLFITAPTWTEEALQRSKQAFVSHYRTMAKSLEKATSDRILSAMLGPERRVRDASPEEVDAVTLESCRAAVVNQLFAGNLELTVVGDFDAAELEDLTLKFIGTIPKRQDALPLPERPIQLCNPPPEQRHQLWHLQDSDERACAMVIGPGPMRWGAFGSPDPPPKPSGPIQPPVPITYGMTAADRAAATAIRRSHPMYSTITIMLLAEIINSRLFTSVRDSLGLTYDVSFEVQGFDRLRCSWFSVSVTSYPDKIVDALNASLAVLRDVRSSPITPYELMRAKRTVLTRHESELKTNAYWIGLLTHLQNPRVPKTIECLVDLVAMYDAATVDDIYDAYQHLQLGDGDICTCIGTSGRQPLEVGPRGYLQREDGAAEEAGGGGGDSSENAKALVTAMMAAMSSMNLVNALKKVQAPPGKQPGDTA